MQIRHARQGDIAAICAIYNAGIASGTGTFETHLRQHQDIALWLKEDNLYPLLVADAHGRVVGFARLHQYRSRDCYDHIAEFSIYLADETKGQGIGTLLMTKLLALAKIRGFHKVLSRIFTFNQASRALCKKLGFREVGIYEKHGQINGRWLDVVIVEYLTENVIESSSRP